MFKRFFKKNKNPNISTALKPTVEVDSNIVYYTGLDKGSFQINLDNLQVIQLLKNDNEVLSLFFFDNHQNFIPIETHGFNDSLIGIESYLKLPKGFIRKRLKKRIVKRTDIWRKSYEQNYSIENFSGNDLTKGFDIDNKEFISWNITYDELAELESTYFSRSEYGHKILKFSKSINLGKIKTDDFILYFDTKRQDVPCYHFNCEFYNALNNVDSYFELKEALIESIGIPISINERGDSNTTQWNIEGLKISISYSFNSPYFFERGLTSFSVFNETKQIIDFQKNEYDSLKNISNIITFYEKVSVNNDFRSNNSVRRFPDELKEKDGNGFFWIDTYKVRFGFAADDNSVILFLEQVDRFSLQNVTPAKGQGGSSLSAILKDKSKIWLMSGSCYYFDRYLKEISDLTGKEVQIEKEYQDI